MLKDETLAVYLKMTQGSIKMASILAGLTDEEFSERLKQSEVIQLAQAEVGAEGLVTVGSELADAVKAGKPWAVMFWVQAYRPEVVDEILIKHPELTKELEAESLGVVEIKPAVAGADAPAQDEQIRSQVDGVRLKVDKTADDLANVITKLTELVNHVGQQVEQAKQQPEPPPIPEAQKPSKADRPSWIRSILRRLVS